jgi:hypothetical protein
MSEHRRISRRLALKGLGVSVGLPLLEAMLPGSVLAAPAAKPPLRMAFVYVPNGKHMADWTPKKEGADFDLPATLSPLMDLRQDLLVLSGLTCDKARPNGDGPGDHARAMSAFLTGAQPRKTHGVDIKVGVSVDQLAARHVGRATRFASLEIGCEGGRNAGNCDSGYSCAYSANLSWRSESTPMSKEINPRQVFDRLFGAAGGKGDPARARRDLLRKSILDFVAEDARGLHAKLGAADKRKLDEYLTGVREVEERLARAEKVEAKGAPKGAARPGGIPKEYRDYLRLMADMLVLAFQADQTRVATFVFANEGSNRPYPMIGVPEGHHDLSHHEGKKAKQERIQKINHFHVTQLAYLLERLKAVKEGAGTLLDCAMILYGSGNSDGNRHNHDDLPILLAGRGGGTLKTGRHVRYPRETPLTNLYVALLERVGVRVAKFGDSTGKLAGLEG